MATKAFKFELIDNPDPVKPQSRRNKVYGYLRDKMHRGELLPGAMIDPKKICSELSISRTPLNNALIRLEAEGIVTIHPRSRVIVNTLEEEDIEYLYEIIGSIESILVAKGFPKYTADILDEMEAWNDRMIHHIKNGDLRSYDSIHYRYHKVFVLLAPNKFAERILIPIQNRLWDFPKKSFPQRWYLDACAEHQYIIAALREGNPVQAVSHIKNVHWGFEFNKKYIQMAYF